MHSRRFSSRLWLLTAVGNQGGPCPLALLTSALSSDVMCIESVLITSEKLHLDSHLSPLVPVYLPARGNQVRVSSSAAGNLLPSQMAR